MESGKRDRIVDAHQHVFWHGRDDTALVADMDDHGIEYAWLLTWEIATSEHPEAFAEVLNPIRTRSDGTLRGIPLEDLLIAKNKHPDRFVLGFCPHPLMGNAPARLKAAAAMFGVKICGEWKFRMLLDDPRNIILFRTAGELGLPVVLHLDVPFLAGEDGRQKYCQDWYGGTVETLERVVTACPDTIFVGHAPGFWREICGNADLSGELYPSGPLQEPGRIHRLLEKHANLYADLSAASALRALTRDPEHAARFVTHFSHKVLFARDYYGDELHRFLSSLELSEDVRQAVYFRNAEKLVSGPMILGCREKGILSA
jgi:predicted TIM-barrel fold metal-dependent hydrolase